MKRTTFLGLLSVALWAAALGVGNAKPMPGDCAVSHAVSVVQDFSSPFTGGTRSVSTFTFAAMDEVVYKPGQARVTGYLFSESPDMPGAPVSGWGAHPRVAFTFATTGLRG